MRETAVEESLAYMLKQVGKPYVWGGTGPRGYDCSGLGYMGYKQGGLYIPRATGAQQFAGTAVTGPMLPGDAIFPHAGHVVWYLGGGRVVEAPHTGLNVRVTDTPSKIWKVRRYATAPQTAWTPQTLKAGFGLDDIAGAVGGAIKKGAGIVAPGAGAIKGGIDATEALGKLAVFLVDPSNWYRVGMFVLGAALLFVAFRGLAQPVGSAIGNTATAAAGTKAGSKLIGKLADMKGAA